MEWLYCLNRYVYHCHLDQSAYAQLQNRQLAWWGDAFGTVLSSLDDAARPQLHHIWLQAVLGALYEGLAYCLRLGLLGYVEKSGSCWRPHAQRRHY